MSLHVTRTCFIPLAIEGETDLALAQNTTKHKDPQTMRLYQKRRNNLHKNAGDFVWIGYAMDESIKAFISYSHKDNSLREQLENHLSPLIRAGRINIWYDRAISAGAEWKKVIDTHITTSHLILLLISPDFISSEYCYGKEMTQALERHYAGKAWVIPIILRPVILSETPFEKLQVLPTNAKPVISWSKPDEAFHDIAVGIKQVVEEIAPKSFPHMNTFQTFPLQKRPKEPVLQPSLKDTLRDDQTGINNLLPVHKDLIVNAQHKAIEHVLPDTDTIFPFNVALTDPGEFYGRLFERKTLLQRTRTGASTSIIGPRRIGKTWLLSYLHLVASKELGPDFCLGYVDATMPSCATVAGFLSRVLDEMAGNTRGDPATTGLSTLERFVINLRSKKQRPVLCIDEFEGLCNSQEFSKDFFTGLRAIAQAGLILVVASKRPLIGLVTREISTSPFFNIFDQRTLKPFSSAEAQKFVEEKGIQAGFTHEEQAYLLHYGQDVHAQWPPLRLQLAGKILLEDKNRAAIDGSDSYRPMDQNYQNDFEHRLEERYQGVVGK